MIQAAFLPHSTSRADALSVNAARRRFAMKEFGYRLDPGLGVVGIYIWHTDGRESSSAKTNVTLIIWLNLTFLIEAAASFVLLPPVVACCSLLTGGFSVIGELGELAEHLPLYNGLTPGFSSMDGSSSATH